MRQPQPVTLRLPPRMLSPLVAVQQPNCLPVQQPAQDPGLGDSDSYYGTRGDLTLWVLDPYFKGQFGSVGIEAEVLYGWGDVDQRRRGNG
jgi:hypothetical protein